MRVSQNEASSFRKKHFVKKTNKALTFTSRGFAISQEIIIFVIYNKLNVYKDTLSPV